MTDVNVRPKAQALPNGYVLDNPAWVFADALKATVDQAPVWTEQKKPDALRSFKRTVGDFTVSVDVGLKGATRVGIDGPTVGRPLEISDFDQESLKAATAGLPLWVQSRVNAAVATAVSPKGVDAVVQSAERHATGLRNWISSLGNKKAAEPASEGPDAALVKQVRDGVITLRATLEQIDLRSPTAAAFTPYHDTVKQLRRTLAQALVATQTNTGMSEVLMTKIADFEILNTSLTNILKDNQLGAVQVADALEVQLRGLNDTLVGQLKGANGGRLTRDLAHAASATGAGAAGALTAAKVKAQELQQGPIGKLIELRAPQQGGVSPSWLEGLQESNESMKNVQAFVGALSAIMRQPMCWGLFATAEQGPEALQIYANNLRWREIRDDREIENKDLAGLTKEQVSAALEDTNERIANGLRKFFKSTSTNDRELVTAILAESRSPKFQYASLVKAMTAAGIPIPDVATAQQTNAAAEAAAAEAAVANAAAALTNLENIAAQNPDITAFRNFLQSLSTLTGQPMRWQVFQEEPTSPQGLYIKDSGFVWDPDGQNERAVKGDEALGLNLERTQDVLEELTERVFNGVAAYFQRTGAGDSQQELANALANSAASSTDKQKDVADLLKCLGDAGVPV